MLFMLAIGSFDGSPQLRRSLKNMMCDTEE